MSEENSMKVVKLKNGAKLPEVTVLAVMRNIASLMKGREEVQENSLEATVLAITQDKASLMKDLKEGQKNPTKALSGLSNLVTVYELGKKAHDKNHKIFTEELEKSFKDLGLLDQNGGMSTAVRDVVVSAITFPKDGGSRPIVSSPIEEVEVEVMGG